MSDPAKAAQGRSILLVASLCLNLALIGLIGAGLSRAGGGFITAQPGGALAPGAIARGQPQDEQDRMAAAIQTALAELPERQRGAILLCHFRGCGNIEAAEIMGLSVEALESLLARGRRALRDGLGPLKDVLGDG